MVANIRKTWSLLLMVHSTSLVAVPVKCCYSVGTSPFMISTLDTTHVSVVDSPPTPSLLSISYVRPNTKAVQSDTAIILSLF